MARGLEDLGRRDWTRTVKAAPQVPMKSSHLVSARRPRCREFPDYGIIVCTTPMPSTARSSTLRGAAQLVGGAQALAKRLGVSELQLQRWISGEETTPTEIFLQAVDLIEQHDRRRMPRPN